MLDAERGGEPFEHQATLDPDRTEQRLNLEALRLMRYDAMAVGANELALSDVAHSGQSISRCLGWQRGVECAIHRSADASPDGRRVRVRVSRVFDAPQSREEHLLEESAGASSSATRSIPEESTRRARARLTIVMGNLSPSTIRRAIAACPAPMWLLSTDDERRWL